MRGFILLLLAVGLAIVVYRLVKGKPGPDEKRMRGRVRALDGREGDLSELPVTGAELRDMISIPGAGDEFEDVDFTVDRRNRYESGGEKWFELSGLHRGQRVHLELYEDDAVHAQLSMGDRDLSLDDLGITEPDLVRMDEERFGTNTVTVDGVRFTYEHSSECTFYRDGLGAGEGYYGWEFRSEDGARTLYIEKWEGESFEVGIAKVVAPEDVRVYRP